MSSGAPVRLAICIPVHHGRAAPLAELFERLEPQLPADGTVEVCVSDNASRDGTRELVASMGRRLGKRVRYQRHETDKGLTANLLAAVELASADYCWLMGSDDVPASGSVARLLELLARNSGLSGLSLGATRRAGAGLREQGADVDIWPRGQADRRLRESGEIAVACGLTQLALSASVVERKRWLAAVASGRRLIERNPLIPQMCAIATMVDRDPDWMSCPGEFFLSRQGTIFLEETEHYRGSPARVWVDVSRQMLSLWRAVHPRSVRAELTEWLRRLAWSPALSAAYRGIEARGRRDLRARLRACRLMIASPEFRRSSMPILLAPQRRISLAAPSLAERPADLLARLDLVGHGPLIGGHGAWIEVRVNCAGPARLSYLGRSRVALFSRWLSSDGDRVEIGTDAHTPVVPSIGRGDEATMAVFVSVPLTAGEYALEIDLLSCTGGWSATEAPLRIPVRVEAPS